MNLYKISQTENRGYDTYDSAVVCAKSHDEARKIQPGGDQRVNHWEPNGTWASKPENVSVEKLGLARASVKAGVVCASFNAG